MSAEPTTAIVRCALVVAMTVCGTAAAGPSTAAIPGGAPGGGPLEYTDVVQDGDFEAGFPNPFWAVDGQAHTVDQISQLDPYSGSWSMSLGGNSELPPFEWWASAEQVVEVDGVGWLAFWLKLPIPTQPYEEAGIRVNVGGVEVYSQVVNYFEPPPGVYEPVFVDLAGLVGPGAHLLRFEAWGLYPQGLADRPGGVDATLRTQMTFFVDQVVFASVDTTCAPADLLVEGKGSCLSELYTPANAQGGQGLTPTFSWQCVDGPYSPCYGYRVMVSDQLTGTYQTACESIGTYQTSCESTLQLDPGTTYYWNVVTYECSLMGELPVCGTATWTFDTSPLPVADFTWAPVDPVLGEVVEFTDLSTGDPTSWLWDFGDGSGSTQQNPTHVFTDPGVYTVSLTVANAAGQDTHVEQLVFPEPPAAGFAWAPVSPQIGQLVEFTDLSTGDPTSWLWGFGDGGTSTQQNPAHTYSAAGTYDVSLTVTNTWGSDTLVLQLEVLPEPPVAEFTWTPADPGLGQPVQFTDLSTGDPTSWSWSFGDGGTSSQQNPSHAFTAPGSYDVSLTVSNASGQDTRVRQVVIPEGPVADFAFSPPIPGVGDVVQFVDQSSGGPTSWSWAFGDGATSTAQHPTHAYGEPGSYTVTLVVGNDSGTDQVSRTLEVPQPGPTADFSWSPQSPQVGQTVSFVDLSSGDPVAWSWAFGDGATSTERNPVHTFADEARYVVSLTVWSDTGSDDTTAAVLVVGATPPPGGGEVTVSPPGTAVGEQVATAVDRSGNRVMVWRQTADGLKSEHDGIFGRMFGPDDQPLGETFEVTTGEAGSLDEPSVAMDGEGNVFVGWGKSGQDGGVFGRLFGSDLTPLGGSIRLDDGGVRPSRPKVAASNAGELAVVWTDVTAKSLSGDGIYARTFGRDGEPKGPAVRVDPGTGGALSEAQVASDAVGRFLVVWTQTAADKAQGGGGVFGRPFGPDGQPTGGPEVLNGDPGGEVKDAAVGVSATGDAVVAWSQDRGAASGFDVFARRLDASGQALGGQIQVNTGADGAQERPSVAVNAAGDFAVAWESRTGKISGGEDGVFGRFFGAGGEALGPDFPVAAPAGGLEPRFPSTEVSGDDAVTVAYTKVGPAGPQGVYFRTFSVDAAPGVCDGGPTALCLNGDRFRVEVVWRDFGDQTGAGQAVPLTDDTGAFWFFDGANLELAVKVLDGRQVNGHFWVFYAAMSNVEFAVTVTDTLTGGSVTYTNPMGNFASVGDTEALPGGGKGMTRRSVPAPVGRFDLEAAALYTELARAGTVASVVATGDCTPDTESLCLGGSRFRVTVSWRAPDGSTGVGRAVPLTSDTGSFWFFDDANLELILKVLDGRWLNGHFWVFYGALSNVEYTVTVTDTETGEERFYSNPMGVFASVGDTEAF